ncbi:MAG: trifunctional histidinol dehydrogenase [Thelocarpon impressellum]|nr:MAG: trifunctional histidinol dehydrogenase [Thelocarpon impressellum]
MTFPFVPALEGPRLQTDQGGLDIKTLSYLGNVFATVGPDELESALDLLQEILSGFGTDFAVHLDVSSLASTDDVLSLLDAGAARAIVSLEQLKHFEATQNIDLDRLVLKMAVKPDNKQQIIEAIGDTSVGVYVHDVKDVGWAQDWLQEYGEDRPPVYASIHDPLAESCGESYAQLVRAGAIPIIPARQLSVEQQTTAPTIPVLSLLELKSDRPDGLVPTVVTDERGVALGLVYSTPISVQESLRTGSGVYHSRKRGLWYKGASSGDTQQLIRIQLDCDMDCLKFTVRQAGRGFCHLATATCFGGYKGLSQLQKTLQSRKESAPEGSYTARLFSSPPLLRAKIMEEAEELCNAETKEQVAFETADLVYFALTKCVEAGVTLDDVEKNLDRKSVKVTRRKGDAKGQWAEKEGLTNGSPKKEDVKEATPVAKCHKDGADTRKDRIRMRRYDAANTSPQMIHEALQRPSQRSTDAIMGIVNPIISAVREKGDVALLEYTHKFERATSLKSPVVRAPFPEALMRLPEDIIEAIDISFENIRHFHVAQKEEKPLVVETMPGVVCSRFARPIERVGLYVPGGTAILPSTALMLGVPAQVAGCKKIVIASPPRADGSITPEIVYVAHKVGAESIVLAGGAQAVAALAYGTESVSKVDKILGPGNQFVTAAKMLVSNDTSAGVSIDMPAGPSEVLVVADATANPAFVASDLLSQAEHGMDSQVVLIAVGLTEEQLGAIEDELHAQAEALPRLDIVRGAIEHSATLVVSTIEEAMALSNEYAPEHLILQVADAATVVGHVENAGSVFIGPWTPESVGDYSAGVNHSLPTYGYAKQYSGVNLASYVKHITSSQLSAQGLRNVGKAVMTLAGVEQLEAHRRAVQMRLDVLDEKRI